MLQPIRARSALRTTFRAAALGALALTAACSIPDWADPASYFGEEYGPTPQPVARAGAEPLPAAQPAPSLAAATQNVERSGERRVAQVADESAATATAATPAVVPDPPRRVAPTPAEPRRAEPRRVARVEQPAPEVPKPIAAASGAQTPPKRSRPTTDVRAGESPTPMIAAMTQGQRPPSFTEEGGIVRRRTDVVPNANLNASEAAQQPVPTRQPSRSFDQQLREAGIEPTGTPAPSAVASSGPVAPGQFASAVPSVVQQNYQDYLNAPRTYSDAVGTSGVAGSGAAGGPVIISGSGVQQTAVATRGAGAPAGGADAVIQFRHGSAQLSSQDRAVLQRVASQAVQTGARVRIRGHSSSRTGEMAVDTHLLANLRVSAARAEAVADALARGGVPYDRILVEAKGDNAPIYNEAMPSGEAGNRRAEIYLEN